MSRLPLCLGSQLGTSIPGALWLDEGETCAGRRRHNLLRTQFSFLPSDSVLRAPAILLETEERQQRDKKGKSGSRFSRDAFGAISVNGQGSSEDSEARR